MDARPALKILTLLSSMSSHQNDRLRVGVAVCCTFDDSNSANHSQPGEGDDGSFDRRQQDCAGHGTGGETHTPV